MASKDNHGQPEQFHATLKGYSIGFILSLLLTVTAYISVVNNMLATQTLTIIIIGLALAQLLVQLLFFLHLGKESKPRLNLTVFSFMVLVVGIIVIGSLWIMHNLDYNMMPKDMEKHMLEQYDQGSI
jgi:cytochrome o ubiquinol oxidase operon protein cyoD